MYMAIMVVLVSFVSFLIIELPPGHFLTQKLQQLQARGDRSAAQRIDEYRARYKLDQPLMVRYWNWISNFAKGDFGESFQFERPVKEIIGQRITMSVILALASILIIWCLAIPIGVYSATHQYSLPDYLMSTFSFLGVGVPAFLWALIIMYFAQTQLGLNVGGLFSEKYLNAPWSWDKVWDMFKHLWIPALIVAIENTAGELRTTRANLLDEVNKPYVELARAKGLSEGRLIWKYPVRVALNPFFSTVGWSLANRISSITLMSIVLSLQTTGPMQLRALTSQDMYLAGAVLLLLSALTVIGTLVSDILLAWVDPRIRLEG